MEDNAIKELEELEAILKEQPNKHDVKQKIEDLKAFFRPYSNAPIFQ